MNPYSSGRVVDYVRGAGGRICDLPGYMLDGAITAVVQANPRHLTPDVVDLLVSGKFRRSMHAQLRSVSSAVGDHWIRRRRAATRNRRRQLAAERSGAAILCSSDFPCGRIVAS